MHVYRHPLNPIFSTYKPHDHQHGHTATIQILILTVVGPRSPTQTKMLRVR